MSQNQSFPRKPLQEKSESTKRFFYDSRLYCYILPKDIKNVHHLTKREKFSMQATIEQFNGKHITCLTNLNYK